MKLTAKIVSVFMIGIALLTLYHGYVTVKREDERLKHEMEQKAQSIGLAMEDTVVSQWRRNGHVGVVQFMSQVNRRYQGLSMQWIALDDGLPINSSLPVQRLRSEGTVFAIASATHQSVYYPIQLSRTQVGFIAFSEPLTEVHQYVRRTIYQTGSVLLGMLLCSGVVMLMGIRMVGRPLEQLIEKTRRIGMGDFSDPIELNGRDEFTQLAGALNQMSQKISDQQERINDESVARVDAVEQLRHADRLKTVGRLASGMAHELGTPLNVVSGRAELIASKKLNEQQILESALAIKSESDRMAKIIRQLLDFARRGSPQRSVVDLASIVQHSVDLIETLAEKQNVTLEFNKIANDEFVANVNEGQIQQALTNLIVNAIQASPEHSRVQIELGVKTMRQPGTDESRKIECCYVSVTDCGHGIEADDQEHLFEPFFTTKDVGQGTGLGLSVAHGIVQDHDGWIDVVSTLGNGTRFTLCLPKS